MSILLILKLSLSFYSILVRLKEHRHYLQPTETDMFLFHTGSIKRERPLFAQPPRLHCFYSILVRLKVWHRGYWFRWFGCFYSILVRLKGIQYWDRRIPRRKFLFHTGSIKSLTARIPLVRLQIRFYSILVRLKGNRILTYPLRIHGFYSILVRLKAPPVSTDC